MVFNHTAHFLVNTPATAVDLQVKSAEGCAHGADWCCVVLRGAACMVPSIDQWGGFKARSRLVLIGKDRYIFVKLGFTNILSC